MNTKFFKKVILLIMLVVPLKINGQSFADNLACYADVTVSDEYSYEFRSDNATDRHRETDWVSTGSRNKWILLKWPYPVKIFEIKLLNRYTGSYDPIHRSELILSDGSIFYVGSIKTHGRKLITINKDGITWVRYLIHSGMNNVGLSEIVVFGE